MKADYPLRFINSVVNEFQKGKECGDENFIIYYNFIISYSLKYPTVNWMKLNQNIFWRNFTNSPTIVFRMVIILKDKNDYKSCVIYKGDCSCGSRYIGETKRNAEVRMNVIIQLKV